MSDDHLYELAEKRINRRNRRWLLWGVNFLGFMSWIAFTAAFNDSMPNGFGAMVMIIWMGVLVLHLIVTGMAQTHDHEVEREVSRLRRELYGDKPKRSYEHLQLSEDGELIDDAPLDVPVTHKRSGDSV